MRKGEFLSPSPFGSHPFNHNEDQGPLRCPQCDSSSSIVFNGRVLFMMVGCDARLTDARLWDSGHGEQTIISNVEVVR